MQGGIKSGKNLVKLVIFGLLCLAGLAVLAIMARLVFSGGIGIFFTMIGLPDIHHLPGLP